jgi:hypothetical protein
VNYLVENFPEDIKSWRKRNELAKEAAERRGKHHRLTDQGKHYEAGLELRRAHRAEQELEEMPPYESEEALSFQNEADLSEAIDNAVEVGRIDPLTVQAIEASQEGDKLDFWYESPPGAAGFDPSKVMVVRSRRYVEDPDTGQERPETPAEYKARTYGSLGTEPGKEPSSYAYHERTGGGDVDRMPLQDFLLLSKDEQLAWREGEEDMEAYKRAHKARVDKMYGRGETAPKGPKRIKLHEQMALNQQRRRK